MDDGDGGGIAARRSVLLGPLSLPPRDSAASTPASAAAAAAAPTPRRLMGGPTKQPRSRCAEMAGARTAECAAVCCCLPCTVLDFVVLTCVNLPVGLCKKAARKRKEKLRKKKMVTMKKKVDVLLTSDTATAAAKENGGIEEAWTAAAADAGLSAEEKQMEKEMWEKFYSTGFWRSGSQQEP